MNHIFISVLITMRLASNLLVFPYLKAETEIGLLIRGKGVFAGKEKKKMRILPQRSMTLYIG